MRLVVVADVVLAINERENWERSEEPVSSTFPFPADDITHGVSHWPGAGDSFIPPTTDTDTIAWLRAMQHDYLTVRGFSLGYGFHISQTSFPFNIWEVRGFDFRNAANDGDKPPFDRDNFNKVSISIQYAASVARPITPDQIMAGRYLLSHIDTVIGFKVDLIGHRDSDDTSCPGDVIYSKIPILATRPIGAPLPIEPKEVEDMKFIGFFEDAYYVGDEVWTKRYGPKLATAIISRYEKAGQPLRSFKAPRIKVNDLEEVPTLASLRGVGKAVNDVAEDE